MNLIPLEMIFDVFKKELKARGMTYQDLANKLHMSESGIKKIFSSEDCSYKRLNEIADALSLSLAEILNALLDNEIKEVQFTIEQERYFLKHPEFFKFFWKLVQEQESVESIREQYHLSEKETFMLLKKLDDFGIIELHAKDVIKIPKIEKVKWIGNGPLIKWMKSEWPKKIIQDVLEKNSLESNEHYSLRYYKLTKKSQEELVQAIEALNHEFAERSLRELESRKKLSPVRMVSAIASGSYV